MRWLLSLSAALSVLAAGPVLPQAGVTGPLEIDGRKSGYLYMDAATRALQDDDFNNPGMFAVDRGAALWSRPEGPEGLSCASCHQSAEDTMRGVAARYPVWDAEKGGLINLELRINDERVRRMQAEPWDYRADEMVELTTYIAFQSRGMPMEVSVEGPAMQAALEAGRAFYVTRRGQLDLACTHCHDQHAGQKLRGDVLSQGQINSFPFYRMLWNSMGSRHRMFAWCNTALRAEPYPLGSQEYLELELYLAWRGRGLPIEAPAVRR